jgi:hypothetical protein
MISPKVIKKYGLDPKSLKRFFTAKVPDPNVARLRQLIADRIKDGRLRNLTEYRTWAAVDMAWDTPFAQTTPTILRNIMENCKTGEETLAALKGYGLAEDTLFTKRDKEGGGSIYELNEQTFNEIFIPLVRAYVTIRLAKLFNDRNLTPLFEYPPRAFNEQNRLLCHILTEVVETVSIEFGYNSTLRDFIFNALMYSVAIKFPVEPWTVEEQEGDDGVEYIVKEGVRYQVPHITRTYWDLGFPLHTLNTGTGCSFAGYWTILKWGDVAMDKSLWNRSVVPHGYNWLDPNAQWYNYFKEVYPCTMEFPTPREGRRSDRENMAFRYTRTDFDSAFFLTYHFQELIPSDWGLGSYQHKVWMRFTIGGDDTIMYAEVFPYHPLEQISYDADSGRGRNASLALEVMPFQDLTGNIFSQFIRTIKRNLANITFYDTDTIDPAQIDTLKRRTGQQYNGLNFVGWSSLQQARAGEGKIGDAFEQVNFQYADANASLLGVNSAISMLERILGMSAQEVGSAASHQQSKKEVEITAGSSTNRLAYTASFVDDGVEAWKRHLAEAIMAYKDGDEIMVDIPLDDFHNLEVNLKELGFEFVSSPIFGQKKATIKGNLNRAHLKLVTVVARRSDADRENDTQIGTLMMQTIQSIANSPMLSSIVSPQSILDLIERAAKLCGVDDDFKVQLNAPGMMANEVKQLVDQIQKTILGAVEKEVVQPVAAEVAGIQKSTAQNNQQIAQEIAQLQQRLSQITQIISGQPASNGVAQPPNLPVAGAPPPAADIAPPSGGAPAPALPPPNSPAAQTAVPNSLVAANPEHREIAKQFLKRACGRKNRARELASQAGYKL